MGRTGESTARRGRAIKLSKLTGRELEVLGLAAEGLRSVDIGGRLGITDATVKSHLHSAYRKLDAPNRVTATRIYLRDRSRLRDVSRPTA
jgi:DNA-binding NarL/FixJ family response regulator